MVVPPNAPNCERLIQRIQRVYRLYRLEGLSLFQRRPRRHRSAMQRNRPPGAQARNECWSMDFVSDQLYDGRKLRALTLIGNSASEQF
jgi:putative transposase